MGTSVGKRSHRGDEDGHADGFRLAKHVRAARDDAQRVRPAERALVRIVDAPSRAVVHPEVARFGHERGSRVSLRFPAEPPANR